MKQRSVYVSVLLGLIFLAGCSESHSADQEKAKKAAKEEKTKETKVADSAEKVGLKPTNMKPYTPKTKEELKKTLTPLQYKVTCEEGTERAFQNEYWDNKKPGIYVDLISGRPLFSSTAKFDSGTGWPSFYEPIHKEEVVQKVDRSWFQERVEVRSKTADSHLGHVFPDAFDQPTGLRYCINSASLRFVPLEKLEEEGYGEYRKLFEKDGKAEEPKAETKPAEPEKKP